MNEVATVSASGVLELTLDNPGRYGGVELRRLRPWLRQLVADLAPDASSFAVRLLSDRQMREFNRTFRDKDRPTDVLSFPGDEGREGWHLGDVCVAVPTARRQAESGGHSLHRELEILLLHGVLHCLGHDHERDDGTMDRLESKLRRRYLTPEVEAV